jgi:transcription-repair coupling factor (superfamily II helicase)
VVTNEAEFIAPPKKPERLSSSRSAWEKRLSSERIPAFIPVSYVSDAAMRIRSYREIAEITSPKQLDRCAAIGAIASERFLLPLTICSC